MSAWLYAPEERRALCDVAKLAALLRGGVIAAEFLDGNAAEVVLGTVGRVTLLAPADLGLASPEDGTRRFVLGRGTDRLCLAEVLAGDADVAAAGRLLAAAAALAAREAGRAVVVWLVAPRVSEAARVALGDRGVATSTDG